MYESYEPNGHAQACPLGVLRGGKFLREMFCITFRNPGRILCPLLHVLPNGTKAEVEDPLLNTGVILPGIGISVIWFGIATALFLYWFRKFEVNQKC